jgi:hypothetical protein
MVIDLNVVSDRHCAEACLNRKPGIFARRRMSDEGDVNPGGVGGLRDFSISDDCRLPRRNCRRTATGVAFGQCVVARPAGNRHGDSAF